MREEGKGRKRRKRTLRCVVVSRMCRLAEPRVHYGVYACACVRERKRERAREKRRDNFGTIILIVLESRAIDIQYNAISWKYSLKILLFFSFAFFLFLFLFKSFLAYIQCDGLSVRRFSNFIHHTLS